MNPLLKRPGTAALLTGLAAFLVYWSTAAPGVGFIDSGELSTVACTLGIAHPTGYPLYTLLGWVFSRLPVAHAEIARLNLMAALLCAAAAGILVLVFRRVILLTRRSFSRSPRRIGPRPSRWKSIPFTSFSSLLCFSNSSGRVIPYRGNRPADAPGTCLPTPSVSHLRIT